MSVTDFESVNIFTIQCGRAVYIAERIVVNSAFVDEGQLVQL